MTKEMKFSKPVFFTQLLIVVLMLGTGLLLWSSLPDMMPSHWNIAGEIDSYMPKSTWIFLFPGITLLITLLFPILSKIDPHKDKYVSFRRAWLIIQTVLVIFFAFLYFVSIYLTFNPSVSITPFVLGGIGVMFILLGNYLSKVRQNYFIGIRTPWTLDNEEVWNKTHRVGSWCFAIAGLFIFAEAFIQWQIGWVIFAAIAVAAIWPIIYSYIIHRKLKK